MPLYRFLQSFNAPCEVCVTSMETPTTPVYMNFTLMNVNPVMTHPTGNGFVKRIFRLKLMAPSGRLVTMVLEEETNSDRLVVPVHEMHIEDDPTQKRYFLMLA